MRKRVGIRAVKSPRLLTRASVPKPNLGHVTLQQWWNELYVYLIAGMEPDAVPVAPVVELLSIEGCYLASCMA